MSAGCWQFKTDGYDNVHIKDDIAKHLEFCQRNGWLREGKLFFREWVDHGGIRGTGYQATCWTILPTSPCFFPIYGKNKRAKRQRALIAKRFLVQLAPGRATPSEHRRLGVRRLPMLESLRDAFDVKCDGRDGRSSSSIAVLVRLRLLVSNTKALDAEIGKCMGRHYCCPQCYALALELGEYHHAVNKPERMLMDALKSKPSSMRSRRASTAISIESKGGPTSLR